MCGALSGRGVQVSPQLVDADVYVIIALSLNDLFTTDNNVKIIITICYPLISVLNTAIYSESEHDLVEDLITTIINRRICRIVLSKFGINHTTAINQHISLFKIVFSHVLIRVIIRKL